MKQLQFRLFNWVFKPSLIGTITLLICIPLFIKLGLWQYGKAQKQQIALIAYKHSVTAGAMTLPLDLIQYDDLKYKKVTVTGEYDIRYQILLDNQVEGDRVGFHVITPLKISNSTKYVLIDRGWIPGNELHADLPVFKTPMNAQVIVGQVWIPSKKIFSLEGETVTTKNWQLLWQYMDMTKYQKLAPINILPMVIRLDASSSAGGFVRNWQVSSDRITTNLGYAYQWFGFAFAAFAIYLYMNIKKVIL